MEPLIDERMLEFIELARSRWRSEIEEPQSFDIGKRLQYLTVDIITQICLGKQLGCLFTDCDQHDFLATIRQANAVGQHFSVLHELSTLLSLLTKMPLVRPTINPKYTDLSGVGRIMGLGLMFLSTSELD